MTQVVRPYVTLESIKESNDDASSRVIHDLHATRSPYKVAVEPASLVFGNIAVGEFSARQIVIIRNVGYLPLSILKIVSVGNFIVSSDPCPTLKPDESFEITVVFHPANVGACSGGIYVDVGDALGQNFVELNGNGQPTADAPADVNITVDGENLS